MEDKHLDELLKGLKRNYDRLPEFTEGNQLVPDLKLEKKRRRRKRWLSYVALVAGVFLFIVLTLPAIGEYRQASVQKEDMVSYIEGKKEELREGLGMSSANFLYEGGQANHILEQYPDEMSAEETKELKEIIDGVFLTPNEMIDAVNSEEEAWTEEQMIQFLKRINILAGSLNNYFDHLTRSHGLDVHALDTLTRTQYDSEEEGELRAFIETLHREGYQLVEASIQGVQVFQIRPDYQALASRIEVWGDYEGINVYFTFMDETFDPYHPGIDNMYGIPWYDFDDVILEVEAMLNDYPESRPLIANSLHTVQFYLNDYLNAGIRDLEEWTDERAEQLRVELTDFIAEHPESIYTQVIARAVDKLEENDWVWQPGLLDSHELHLLPILYEQGIEFDQIYPLNQWPIIEGSNAYLSDYVETGDVDRLRNLSSFDFVAVFAHASVVNHELYHLLQQESGGEVINWFDVYRASDFLVEYQPDVETIEYKFISNQYGLVAEITLTSEPSGWTVSDEEKFELEEPELWW